MNTEFERTRLDIAGQGVTITSWYESGKQRYRANAPAFLHLFNDSDAPDAQNTGSTRAGAVRAVRDRLETRLTARASRSRL
jgi:hypothetical protein